MSRLVPQLNADVRSSPALLLVYLLVFWGVKVTFPDVV
jgi:hypothetical protein